MSTVDVDAILREELGNIAPDVELETIDPRADLREALDIEFHGLSQFCYRYSSSPWPRHSRTRLSETRDACRGARLPQGKAC